MIREKMLLWGVGTGGPAPTGERRVLKPCQKRYSVGCRKVSEGKGETEVKVTATEEGGRLLGSFKVEDDYSQIF